MPNWDDLRYFLSISREGSLAAAGRTLRVDATTVGRRLAVLEKELGTRLFDRMPSGFILTEAGRNISAAVEQMEASMLAVERKASGDDARLEGVVRVTTTEAFAVSTLLPRFGPLRERHPGIEVQILTDYAALDLTRREADIAVRLTRPKEETLVARKVGEIAIAPYAAESYLARRGQPDPATGFAGHEVISYTDAAAKWPEAGWMGAVATSARVALRCNSLLSVVAAAEAGVGIGLMPCFMGDQAPRLRRLMPPVTSLRREIWLVVHRDLQSNARVRAVLHFMAELIQRERALISGEGLTSPAPEPPAAPKASAVPRKPRSPPRGSSL